MNQIAEPVLEEEEEVGVVEEEINDDEMIAAMDEELAAGELEPEVEAEEPEAVAETPEPTDEEVEPDAVPEEEEKPEEPKPEEPKVEEPKEEKPSDEFGTLEDSVPEKTRERFETIKSKYDEAIQERDLVKAEADKWVESITSTGTNPEQFGMALTWLKKVNSQRPEDLEDAYAIMSNELQVLGKALGKPVPGVYNPLDEHQDLKQKVDDGYMDEAAAMEVAQARATRKLSETSRSAEQQSQTEKQLYDSTLADVRKFGEQLQASDPYFQAKMPYLEPIITAAVSGGAPPEKWLHMIKSAYDKLPNPVATSASTTPKPNVPDPIRPTGTTPASGGMEKEPGNELEALNQALARGY